VKLPDSLGQGIMLPAERSAGRSAYNYSDSIKKDMRSDGFASRPLYLKYKSATQQAMT